PHPPKPVMAPAKTAKQIAQVAHRKKARLARAVRRGKEPYGVGFERDLPTMIDVGEDSRQHLTEPGVHEAAALAALPEAHASRTLRCGRLPRSRGQRLGVLRRLRDAVHRDAVGR